MHKEGIQRPAELDYAKSFWKERDMRSGMGTLLMHQYSLRHNASSPSQETLRNQLTTIPEVINVQKTSIEEQLTLAADEPHTGCQPWLQ